MGCYLVVREANKCKLICKEESYVALFLVEVLTKKLNCRVFLGAKTDCDLLTFVEQCWVPALIKALMWLKLVIISLLDSLLMKYSKTPAKNYVYKSFGDAPTLKRASSQSQYLFYKVEQVQKLIRSNHDILFRSHMYVSDYPISALPIFFRKVLHPYLSYEIAY